jgi:hypothetical protein
MPIVPGDISYLYSGGSSNNNPNLSLGGAPSIYSVNNNTLFDNVTNSEASLGMIDYRCLYISNDSASEILYNSEIYILYDPTSGAEMEIGFEIQNDRQYVNISNFSSVTGGTITLTYTDTTTHNFNFSYDVDVNTFASNFQTAINLLDYLTGVTVSASYDAGSNTLSFEVNFLGDSGARYQELLILQSNSLTYSGSAPNVSIVKSVNGSPINKEATLIDVETTPPTSVVFSTSSYSLGTFRNLDVIPVWIKRTVAANSQSLEVDGFSLRIKGDAVFI